MNNEDIYIARKKYEAYLKSAKELLRLKSELEELSNNPAVKRYLELKSIEEKTVYSNDMMLRYSFSNVKTSNIPKKQKIYIYMGAYKKDRAYDSRADYLLSDGEWESADYLLYMNIDSEFDSVSILPKNRENFEKEYTILRFNNTFNIKKKYYDLQQFYFDQLINIDLRKKNSVLKLLNKKVK